MIMFLNLIACLHQAILDIHPDFLNRRVGIYARVNQNTLEYTQCAKDNIIRGLIPVCCASNSNAYFHI